MSHLSAGKLWGMRRMADSAGRFKMTAVDQRPPIKGPIAAHYGTEAAPYDDVARFKALLTETLQGESSAMLLDPHFAVPRGLRFLSPQKGLIVTLEDSLFEDTGEGRLSSEIDDWSVGKIKRMGGRRSQSPGLVPAGCLGRGQQPPEGYGQANRRSLRPL